MNEAETFLFRYQKGTLRGISENRIIWLFSFLDRYNQKVIQRSKSLFTLLLDLPDHLFAYMYYEYHYELSYFFENNAIKRRIHTIQKNERSRSLALFLDKKEYVHTVRDIGAATLMVSFEKGSLKYNNQSDALLVIENGSIRMIYLTNHSPYDDSVNQKNLKRGLYQLQKDLKDYEIHNKIRLELTK